MPSNNILIYKPGVKSPEVTLSPTNELTWQFLKDIVGGYIQVVKLNGFGKTYLVVMDEEGKMKEGVLPNRRVRLDGRYKDILVGTLAVCRERGEDMVCLTDMEMEEAKLLMEEWTVMV